MKRFKAFLFLSFCAFFFAGNIHAQQAPSAYVIVTPGTIYNLPFVQGGGPDTAWPSLNFTVGDSSNGIAVSSAVGAAGGTVTFHGASNQVTPAVWRSIGSVSIYIKGGPGTPYHLEWNCSANANVTSGSMGLYQTLVDTVGGICAGDVSISVLSYNGPLSLQKSLNNSGTIDGTTSGQTTSNPAFPGVTYSYATNLLSHWIYVAGSDVGGSGNNGIAYVGSASLDVIVSFTVNLTGPTALSIVPGSAGGNNQVGNVSTQLPNPLVVKATDQAGNPAAGIPISVSITQQPAGASGAALTIATATTGVDGTASTQLTLGNLPGQYQVTASCGGSQTCIPNSVTFTQTAEQPKAVLKLTLDQPTIEPYSGDLTLLGPTNLATATAIVTDTTGQPISLYTVQFQAQAGDLTLSGHDHAMDATNLKSAPTGVFEDLNTAQSTQSCTTDVTGTCQLSYASEISGPFIIIATSSADPSVTAKAPIAVQFNGLELLTPQEALLGTNVTFRLVGACSGDQPAAVSQHCVNHYANSYIITAVEEIAYDYFEKTSNTLGINDMSLIWGGLFDICNNWDARVGTAQCGLTPQGGPVHGHVLHRYGKSVDINTTVKTASGDVLPTDRMRLQSLAKEWNLVPYPEGTIHYDSPF